MYINPVFIFVRDLVVPSPVEDYFLYIDDMAYPDKVRIGSPCFNVLSQNE